MEGARLDHAVFPESGQRLSLGVESQRFDHVPGEVEPVRDLPATVLERGIERELEGRGRKPFAMHAAAADAKLFHGTPIIDPNRLRVEGPPTYVVRKTGIRSRGFAPVRKIGICLRRLRSRQILAREDP
jgi:hypothetical protein